MKMRSCLVAATALTAVSVLGGLLDKVEAQEPTPLAAAPHTPADLRAQRLLDQMTDEEKLVLVFGYFGSGANATYSPPKDARAGSAGYVAGVPRLGIPPQWQTDAGIGVATQHDAAQFRERTALPSGLATAATWNLDLAYEGGRMIGAEARASGFNVMLAGGVNLARDPRNGRNFEYGGEDPLLAGQIVSAQVRGIQSNGIISTIKHYAVNDQENGRFVLDARIDQDQARMSDLLAFEIAIEQAKPGAIMCAYNRINGDYACENDWLMNKVLKRDWGFKGYVMSDWGADHSDVKAALAGLDQESAGQSFDKQPFFAEPLKAAVARGEVLHARLNDMARRILWAMADKGLLDTLPDPGPIDLAAHAKVTQADAEQAIVLLKNEGGLLPLAATARRIAVIGSHADVGVLSGGGSSQVYPVGGMAVTGLGPKDFPGPIVYFPTSPLKALQARRPDAVIRYADGTDLAAARTLAADSDLVIVFGHQWSGESIDNSLHLDEGGDALIAAVAAANPHTVVVLETGGPVVMPWVHAVPAVVEAWYPGTQGGEAIANILTGAVNPSGHLPITFPVDESQLPRPRLDGDPARPEQAFTVNYSEGAAVGYKWFDRHGLTPLFPFGHGLSYTRFAFSHLKARVDRAGLTVRFDAANIGDRVGMAAPQIYVGPVKGGWEAPKRLAGWRKATLRPGETGHFSLTVDPRLLATFRSGWRIAPGRYRITLGASSREVSDTTTVMLAARRWPARHSGK